MAIVLQITLVNPLEQIPQIIQVIQERNIRTMKEATPLPILGEIIPQVIIQLLLHLMVEEDFLSQRIPTVMETSQLCSQWPVLPQSRDAMIS